MFLCSSSFHIKREAQTKLNIFALIGTNKLKTHNFHGELLNLKTKNDRPDKTQNERRISIDYVLSSDILQVNLKRNNL